MMTALLAGTTLAQEPQLYQGGNGRGDAAVRSAALAQPLFAGGTGRGDARGAFAGLQRPLFAGGGGNGDGTVAFEGLVLLPFGGADGRGDAREAFRAPGVLLFAGGDGRGDGSRVFAGERSPLFAGGDGRGDARSTFSVALPTEVFLALRAVLGGAYDPATGLMRDGLRTLPDFPLTEPYTALGYPHVNGGGEQVAPALLATTGANAVVDWVVVEFRDALAPATVLYTRCGLLQRDGDVVDATTGGALQVPLPAGAYTVAVRHRNHLGVMAAVPVQLGASATVVDLSAEATPTFGTEARRHITGAFPVEALWAGDVTNNGEVKYTGGENDRDPVLSAIGGVVPTATITGYRAGDVNLDGEVRYTGTDNDRDPILQTIGGVVPTNSRVQQLP